MSDAEQLYGWYSDLHLQALPESYAIYATPDGREVKVTNVCHSSSDPGIYAWPDARCVGPVVNMLSDIPGNYFKQDYLKSSKQNYLKYPDRLLYRTSGDRVFIKSQNTAICDKFARLIKNITPTYDQ